MKHTRSDKDARDSGGVADAGGGGVGARAREDEKLSGDARSGGALGKRGAMAALKNRRSLGANRLALKKDVTNDGTSDQWAFPMACQRRSIV